jgi:hypothetical protein
MSAPRGSAKNVITILTVIVMAFFGTSGVYGKFRWYLWEVCGSLWVVCG